jgi:YtxH-like protein
VQKQRVFEIFANASPLSRIFSVANSSSGDTPMRFKRREPFFSFLLDSGLDLLDSIREHIPDNVDHLRDRARSTYETASHRVGRAGGALRGALRGEKDSQLLGKGIALLIGIGIGMGIGVLIAPASGEETRDDIANTVSDCGEKVPERSESPQRATAAGAAE